MHVNQPIQAHTVENTSEMHGLGKSTIRSSFLNEVQKGVPQQSTINTRNISRYLFQKETKNPNGKMGKSHEKVVLSLKDEIQTTEKYTKRRSTSPIMKECKLEPRNVIFSIRGTNSLYQLLMMMQRNGFS